MSRQLWEEWDYHIDKGHTVIMDNDGWWFLDSSIPEEEYQWVSGGEGPYGLDLLEYMLHRAGIKMEPV